MSLSVFPSRAGKPFIHLRSAKMVNSQKDSSEDVPKAGPSGSAKSLGKAFSRLDIDGHNLPPSPAPSSPRDGKRYALATELVYTEGTDQYNSSSQPIYQVRQKKRWPQLRLFSESGETTIDLLF